MAAISLLDYANQSDTPMKAGLVKKITNESIFFKLLRFIPVDGFAYRYNLEETLGGIAYRTIGGAYTDDVGVVNPKLETLPVFGGSAKTDWQIANKPSGAAVRSSKIAAKTQKAGLFFDNEVIKGNPALDPKAMMGLYARLVNKQVISAGTNGGPLTLALLDQAIDQTVGTSNEQKAIVCNKSVRRKITALKLAAAGGAAVTDVGMQLSNYNGCPIQVVDEDGAETAILDYTETQGSSNVTTSLLVVRPGSDSEGEYLQGLVGSNMIEKLPTAWTGEQIRDIVEMNAGIALFHPRAATRIQGITNA